MKKFSAAILASVLLFSLTSCQQTRQNPSELPTWERAIFILDISKSNNVTTNWKNALRPSLIRVLKQPFGSPVGVSANGAQAPYDIYVTTISSDSVSEERMPIVTIEDAQKIWGKIDSLPGMNSVRLEDWDEAIFGGAGIYTELSRGLAVTPLVIPSSDACINKVINDFGTQGYIGKLKPVVKKDFAQILCGVYSNIVKNLIRIDNKFESPQCSGKCSDVFGAIVNASRVAEDLVSAGDSSETPSLCVAISSDMYNMSPTTETSGPLNSREIVRTAKSVEEAEERGIEAAKLINIKFPIAVKTRVFVLSSSGPGSLPLERNIYFDAYWNAFWSEVGIESTEQIKSLDQACIQSGRTSR